MTRNSRCGVEETVGCAVIAVNIHAIDLEAELLWRGPDESAHPPVADRDSLFTAKDGLLVNQVRAGDQPTKVDGGER